ncbi:diuretic hormone class 2 [Diorhabda sublineata]|uniref:diuretic hormone class 2 n=1 Tax=Diorhabda sublineata TaxID=1163346 RepID=UPI0024E04501|nr:diuretic hormone class 2 [Diorhabda sublineata]
MKGSGFGGSSGLLFLIIIAGIVVLKTTTTNAQQESYSYPGFYSPIYLERQNPKYLMQTISRLRQALINDEEMENSKRGLDLGLGRGFSGSQAAKHLMGLAAANFAGGPGRKRRSEDGV